MGGQTFLFAFICFLAYFQAFQCKTLGHERKARSYDECKPGRKDSCRYTKCKDGRELLVLECTCPNMVNYRCPCIDHNGMRQDRGNKYIYQFNGEALYCGCDKGDSGYCKRGCMDNDGNVQPNGKHYEFEGDNGKYSCECKNSRAQCSKGFTLPAINSNRPGPVLPPRPGLPALPPRPPQLPPRP